MTTIGIEELDALEKVAREAGDADWIADLHRTQTSAGRTYGFIHAAELVPIAAVPLGVEGCDERLGRARARHIATFDPPTILRLIAALRAKAGA